MSAKHLSYTLTLIQYNSHLLETSKLTRATTAITGNNIYSNNESVNVPHRKNRKTPLTPNIA